MANEFARQLRQRMNEAERRLWFRLRPLRREGLHFRRQSPIGRFIVDFECRRAKLVVELDGSQHREPEHAARDAERDAWLGFRDYLVLRFESGAALKHTDEVMHEIITTARFRLQMLQTPDE